jgi:hypothetical protein
VPGRAWLGVPLCYLALGVLFFWPALWSGAVPLPLTNPYLQPDAVWHAYAPPDAAQGANLLLGDVSGFYYPYMSFTIASLRAGQFPLWNPDLFGGMPYFAANQAALLYPINLICYWLGPHDYWVAAALLRLLVAGCGTYLLARQLGVGRLGALLAGGVYMFAAFNVVWLHFAIHNVAALLPLALWLIARLARRPCRRDTLALAAVVAAQMYGGHPETSLFFLAVCGAFAAVWLLGARLSVERADSGDGKRSFSMLSSTSSLRAGGSIALACALGLGLSAAQWAPTLDLIRKSETFYHRRFAADRGLTSAPDFAPLGGVPRASWGNLRHWLLLVAPELWGSPRGDRIRNWLPEHTNYNELASYAGLVALALALAGAQRGANRRAARFFGALLLLALLLLYPLPGLYRLGYVRPLDIAYGVRFGLGVALAAAVLAGLGLDWLRAAGSRGLWAASLLVTALAALNLAVLYDLFGGLRVRWALGFVPDAATRATIAEVYTAANWRLFLPAAAGLLAAGALAAAALGRLAGPRAAALVVTLALAELIGNGFGFNGFTPPAAVYPRTALIARLGACGERPATCDAQTGTTRPAPFRVLNLDGTFWANSAMTHGIQVTGGLDDLAPAVQRPFLARGMAGVVQVGDRQIALDWGRRLMDIMNVRYIVSSRVVADGPRGAALPLEMQDGEARLYRNDSALPRAYAATSVVQASGRGAEDAVFSAAFDPHRSVVLEEAPPAGLSNLPAPVTPVAVVSYTPDRVELAPDLRAASIVVLADSYDPDWHVTIDGQEARLLRANGMLRGILVPAGAHRVVFSYEPRLVLYGALASVATLLGCAAWVIGARWMRNG